MRKRSRKQRVALRSKRREAIKGTVSRVFRRSAMLAVIGGLGLGAVARGDVYVSRLFSAYTPQITVSGPEALAGLPVRDEFPKHSVLLWLPWGGRSIEKRVQARFPAVRRVHFEKHVSSRRIQIRLESRTPVVILGESGMDVDGVVFPVSPGALNVLPQASLSGVIPKPAIGAWLRAMTSNPLIWQRVTSVREDKDGLLWLTFRSGTEVLWGDPVPSEVRNKGVTLIKVLEDAQTHLRGAAQADLRFFSEGRIIVKPRLRG